MNEKRVALVTGANQGIGLQIAKDLAAAGLTVLVGARDRGRGEEAARKVGEGARLLELDVTSQRSIDAAAATIGETFGRLDVLVNNAGISHMGDGTFEQILERSRVSTFDLAEVRAVFEVNVFGVLAVTKAMLPLLRRSAAGRIVNVSSSAGSLTLSADPKNPYRHVVSVVYPPTKAALNLITVATAIELEGTGIKVNAACPGFTSTALNEFRGTRTVEEGAREPVRLALLGDDGPTGTFSNDEGPLPW